MKMSSFNFLSDRTLHFLNFTILLMSLTITWLAIAFSNTYPSINAIPKNETFNFLPILLFGMVLFIVILPIALNLFRPVVVALIVISILFLPLAIASLFAIVNITYSGPEKVIVVATVKAKREVSGGKTHTYILQVSFMKSDDQFEFEAPYRFYKDIKIDDRIVLKIKKGFFGHSWLQSYEKTYVN